MTDHSFLGTVNRASGLLTILVAVLGAVGGIIALTWQSARQFDALQFNMNTITEGQAQGQVKLGDALNGLGALSSHVNSIDAQLAAITAARVEQAAAQSQSHDSVLQLQGQVTALQSEVIALQGGVTSAQVAVSGLSKDVGDIRCKLWPSSQCPSRNQILPQLNP